LSYGSSPASEHDGGAPEEFKKALAEIKNRISLLARQCEAITRRNGNVQQDRASDLPTDGVPQALAHFSRSLNAYYARRLEQISSTSQSTDVSRSLNGRHLGAANIAEAEKEFSGTPARDTRGGLGQLVDSQLASRLGGIVQELRSDFDSKIAGLTNKFERQISLSSGIRATEAAEREASLLAQIDKIAARLSDKYDREAQSLARNLEDQLKRSFSGESLGQRAHSEMFINEFVDKIDGRLAAITEQFSAELANMRKKTNAISADVDREIAGRANRKRSDFADAEGSVKKLQEHLDRCVSEITAFNIADAGKNDVKISEIDRTVSALGQRVDVLIASLAEAERANSARKTELVGSLESTVAALAERSHADSQSLARILGGNLLELTDATRAEAAKTTALIGSLDEKIAAFAEKGRTETESLTRTLGEQIEGDVLKLAENTRSELAQTITLLGALETKIAALADRGHEDSATLARTFQSSLQELSETSRAETDRTTGIARSLETKIAALGAQTQAESASLANTLSHQIENKAVRLTQNAHAESAKTTALVGSLEQKLVVLTQTGHAHSEALAKTLHQTTEAHAREFVENSRAEAVRTMSFIESLENQIATSSDISRAEAAKATALLDEKIAALGEKNKADSESLARILGQQIEHHVQGLTEYTRAEAARTSALVGSLEHTVTVLAEKGKADSESLARGLGQEIAGHVLHLTKNASATTAKTLDLIGSLEDRIATLAKQGRTDSESLARTLSQEIERHVLALTESTRAEAAATSALFESKIATLSGKVQADTELLANTLSRHIESSARQLAEGAQAEAAKTAALIGSLEAKIATMVERGSAESVALAQTLTQQIEAHAREHTETTRAEAAKTAALVKSLHESVSAVAEKSTADSELLRQNLGQQIEAHTLELAQSTRVEISNTNTLLDQKIAALAESGRAISESLAQTLSQKIETHVRELTANTREEAIRATNLFENKITALADKSQADTEALVRTLSQQIESRAFELSENTKTEAAKTTTELENKIAALAEQGRADTQDLARTLGLHIQTQGRELTENARAEAARTSAFLENKIAALAEMGQAETASLAKDLSHQIESHVRELTETTRADAAKTTALIGSLEEKIAALVEKNRAALELQATALGAQLKIQLVELSEANDAQTADLRKLLDTGIAAVEHSTAKSSEAGRAEFRSRFEEIDEQFRRRINELSQQNVAGTEALAETLRHRIDLGIAALIEGSRAESVAFESLLRTATEQIYRKVGALNDNFQSESKNSHKNIDALRISIDHQLDVLTESSQEHFTHLTDLTGGMVERLDVAETQLSHIEAAHAEQAQSLRQRSTNRAHSHAHTNGHASAAISDPAETIAAQDSEHLATRMYPTEANGHAVAADISAGVLAPSNGAGLALSGQIDDKSDSFHTEDPFDPIIATPERGLVSDIEGPSKRKPRIGYVRRWFGFNRAKY